MIGGFTVTGERMRVLPDGLQADPASAAPMLEVPAGRTANAIAADGSQGAVLAAHRLQDIADHRGALQHWFRALRVGGRLIVTVPHAFLDDRQLILPSPRRRDQKRLYTPASLLAEVEEALVPNSYRIRGLEDRDAGYDYALDRREPPVGEADVVLVLERIEPPSWPLGDQPTADLTAPDYGFEPRVTRREIAQRRPVMRLLVLKLDHLGDFIMGIPALRKLRTIFPAAHITLVVGSWNLAIARDMGVADEVLEFDAFPRNSSEEEVDVPGKRALFEALVREEYDLAIDLRTDFDTRFLLRSVRTRLRSGIGSSAEFPFLDIFLPTGTHLPFETARTDVIGPARFAAQPGVARSDFRLSHPGGEAGDGAIVWGPYIRLRPGRYIFEPFVEIAADGGGLLLLDVGLDVARVAEIMLPSPSGAAAARLEFTVEREADFEFRIWTVADAPAAAFSFFGGRLLSAGAPSVLHQSEYLLLLVELIALRSGRFGVFGEDTA